jgi:hypothetical protein
MRFVKILKDYYQRQSCDYQPPTHKVAPTAAVATLLLLPQLGLYIYRCLYHSAVAIIAQN